MVFSELVKSKDWNVRVDGTKKPSTTQLEYLGEWADGRWTVDRPDIRTGPIPIPPLPFEGPRIPRERITKQD